MPADDPTAVIRRWVEAWNAQDLDAAEELLAPEFVRHDANLPDVVGPQAERQHIADDLTAFPDLHFEIEQLIAEGDLVAAHYLGAADGRGRFIWCLGMSSWFTQPTSSSTP
jgi:C-1 hydroxylase